MHITVGIYVKWYLSIYTYIRWIVVLVISHDLRTAKVQPYTLLITLDVESMYTNIDNEQGLEAVRNIFQANPSPRRSEKQIVEHLELSLKNNYFEFNNKNFLQISGTAMGKKFAPSYANLFTWHNGKIQPWRNATKNQQCTLDIWMPYRFCGTTVKLSSKPSFIS